MAQQVDSQRIFVSPWVSLADDGNGGRGRAIVGDGGCHGFVIFDAEPVLPAREVVVTEITIKCHKWSRNLIGVFVGD